MKNVIVNMVMMIVSASASYAGPNSTLTEQKHSRQNWSLVESVCVDVSRNRKETKVAKLLPTDKKIKMQIEMDANGVSTKKVYLPDCDASAPLMSLAYTQKFLTETNGKYFVSGRIANLQLLSIKIDKELLFTCDKEFARQLEKELLYTDRLENEMSNTYSYTLTRDSFTLSFYDQGICSRPNDLVQLLFQRTL